MTERIAAIELPHLLLILAKTEYTRADAFCDGCVDDVLLAKTGTPHGRISVEDLADCSGAAVSLEHREEAACLIEMHAEQLVCRAALALGYGEPPAGSTFPLHRFARTQELWRGTPEGNREPGTDWFFPVGLFQEIVVCESPVDNFPAGISGFCQAIAAVVAESKLPGDFQILKDWRLPVPFTADEEAARLIWWTHRPSTHLPMRRSDAPQGKHTIDVGRFWKASVKAFLLGEFAQGSATMITRPRPPSACDMAMVFRPRGTLVHGDTVRTCKQLGSSREPANNGEPSNTIPPTNSACRSPLVSWPNSGPRWNRPVCASLPAGRSVASVQRLAMEPIWRGLQPQRRSTPVR